VNVGEHTVCCVCTLVISVQSFVLIVCILCVRECVLTNGSSFC